MRPTPEPAKPISKGTKLLSLIIVILLLAGAWYGSKMLKETAPKAQKREVQKQATLVETATIASSDYPALIYTTGEVSAATQSDLQANVAGEVVWTKPGLVAGLAVNKGDLLVEIDPTDYEVVVLQQEASLADAQADYQIELGEQAVARKEYELMGQKLTKEDEVLALREPQLKQAKAALKSAKAALKKAQIDLERTKIVAPFSGIVLSVEIEKGERVSTGSTMLTLLGTDKLHVVADVSESALSLLDFGKEGSRAEIVPLATSGLQSIEGTVTHLLADVDSVSKKPRILITITTPPSVDSPILLDSRVSIKLFGKTLESVAKLPWKWLRSGDKIWVMTEEDKLAIEPAHIAHQDEEGVYLRDLDASTAIVTTALNAANAGMKLTTLEKRSQAGAGEKAQ